MFLRVEKLLSPSRGRDTGRRPAKVVANQVKLNQVRSSAPSSSESAVFSEIPGPIDAHACHREIEIQVPFLKLKV